MERTPSRACNGASGPGSANRASPKPPRQGVWAVHRAGPIRADAMLRSSKSSIRTGVSSQEPAWTEVTCTMGRLRAMKAILAAKIELFINSLLASTARLFLGKQAVTATSNRRDIALEAHPKSQQRSDIDRSAQDRDHGQLQRRGEMHRD